MHPPGVTHGHDDRRDAILQAAKLLGRELELPLDDQVIV
jgi:hypothetical protein